MVWPKLSTFIGINLLCFSVIKTVVAFDVHHGTHIHHEKQSYNGWYNNPYHAEWGSAGSQLVRQVTGYYDDGVYAMKSGPNARYISNMLFMDNSNSDLQSQNDRNLTTMVVFFTQLVWFEIMNAVNPGCPLEVEEIPVPKGDPTFDPKNTGKIFLPYTRAKYDPETGLGPNNPRKQVNDVTSWIDGSVLYGTNEAWITMMRTFVDGTLLEGDDGFPPQGTDGMYLFGDERVNHNPAVLSLAIILFRWHNYQARRFAAMHPHWTDNVIYVHARRWVVGTLQKIIIYDFLPIILNEPASSLHYKGYNAAVNPAISPLFAGAAFNFHDTLIPAGLLQRKPQRLANLTRGSVVKEYNSCGFEKTGNNDYKGISLCHHWWKPTDAESEIRVEEIAAGMTSQLAEKDDMQICSEVRSHAPGHMWMQYMDIVTEVIMRGRDYGLPDYNNARIKMGLSNCTSLHDINPKLFRTNPKLYQNLLAVYGNTIENLDVYVGGMLEPKETGPGELFKKIIKDQFVRIRDGDRYWFENTENEMLGPDHIEEIWQTTFADILIATTHISEDDIGTDRNVFIFSESDPCFQPHALDESKLGRCFANAATNYFNGNGVSFVFSLTALGIVPFICLGIAFYLTKRRSKTYGQGKPTGNASVRQSLGEGRFQGVEWVHARYSRTVSLIIKKSPTLALVLEKPRGGLIRKIDFDRIDTLTATLAEAEKNSKKSGEEIPPFLLLHVPNSYDSVLRFESVTYRGFFLSELQRVLTENGKSIKHENKTLSELLNGAETREKRQEKLEHFFREAYAKAFDHKRMLERTSSYSEVSPEILNTFLSRAEFAEALGMRENDLFVQRMFASVARTHRDQICFKDFLEMIAKFANGDTSDKLEILFDMCDREKTGKVDKTEFGEMLKSLQGAAGVKEGVASSEDFVNALLMNQRISPSQKYLSRDDFSKLLNVIGKENRPLGIEFKGHKKSIALQQPKKKVTEPSNSFGIADDLPEQKSSFKITRVWNQLTVAVEENRREVIILFLFFGASIIVFMERFSYYATGEEHNEAVRVMGYGNAIARGGAAGLSFCFAVILLTVCRNVITLLRSTALDKIIPFDSAVAFHRVVAYTGLFYSAVHTIAHCINFYAITTQTKESLECLFSHSRIPPLINHNINYWLFGTVTGFTGVALVVIMSIIYVFATPMFVRGAYRAFKITHYLGILFYALTIAHSIPSLLARPRFWAFVIGPIFIFTVDRLYLLNVRLPSLQIIEANLLPSDVTHIRFKRSPNFHFRSGQYVRISCTAIDSVNDKHAFSLASAPQDPAISLYIKAVGKWTWQLRTHIEKCLQSGSPLPQIRMDGPYGEGNQDWWNYEVAVCVGGGIGITPYASILRDLVHSTAGRKFTDVACKKVYYFWICPKHEDWFVDVLREVEEDDEQNILEIHIYVTRFFHKFDLRTTMLYICEKHFRGVYGKSMFTNLRATHHFGRPDLSNVLKIVQNRHKDQTKVGVFSCGLPQMNRNVREACQSVNRTGDYPMFVHQYASF